MQCKLGAVSVQAMQFAENVPIPPAEEEPEAEEPVAPAAEEPTTEEPINRRRAKHGSGRANRAQLDGRLPRRFHASKR